MQNEARTTYWREGLLLAAFLVLAAVAIATVALPELSDTPDSDDRGPSTDGDADAGR